MTASWTAFSVNRSFDFIERIIQADITMWRLGLRLIMGITPLQSMASQARLLLITTAAHCV
jgi:hypothetical protein